MSSISSEIIFRAIDPQANYITKSKYGIVCGHKFKPRRTDSYWKSDCYWYLGNVNVVEFKDLPWETCILKKVQPEVGQTGWFWNDDIYNQVDGTLKHITRKNEFVSSDGNIYENFQPDEGDRYDI